MSRITRSLVLASTLSILACADSPASPDPDVPGPPARDLTWLEAHAVPFRTAEPGGDRSDLLPLKEIIGDARVVALGEGTHGTREFFQMKHRVLEFLVEEMGFTHFGIEATWGESNHVDRYVHTGQGDPPVLLSNLYFWTWNTRSVLDMILWMREHNQRAAGGDISFFGFDMQFSREAMRDVEAFVTRVDVDAITPVGVGYYCWSIWEGVRRYATVGDSIQADCRAGVESVHALLAERRDEYEAAAPAGEYAHALRAARIVVQHEHLASRRWADAQQPAPRDRYMAENVQWLLEEAGPDARIVLWAHNAHVMDRRPWMGSFLRDAYGDDMVVVGFSFYQGSFNAVTMAGGEVTGPLTSHSSAAPLAGSYEHYFGQLGLPRFLVDLRPLRHDPPPSATWLRGPLPVRMIGAAYDASRPEQYYFDSPLPREFDAWIHFQYTQASHLLPFVSD
jgi:erythromycin esterase